ncbi:MAG: hypothetical protein JWM88_3377 [Verrucomicrobia bacterium]|nr:hypothetical protein [Verrucomicrobiota bacterium]
MKTTRLFLTAFAGFAAIATVFAADKATKTNEKTEVVFSHPEKFADVRDSYNSDAGRDALLSQLEDYIKERGRSYVPDGDKLVVTVTDIDLAGDFEPWRGPQLTDVRIVKDIYPPKVDLEYKLVGPDGVPVKTGKRQLRDLAFMMKISITRDDSLRFEKALIDDWFRSEFPRVAKN